MALTDHSETTPATPDYVPPDPPEGLGEAGKAAWRVLVADVQWSNVELLTVRDIAVNADQIDRVEKEIEALPSLITYSNTHGHRVIDAVNVLRQLQLARKTLIGSLQFPNEDGEKPKGLTASELGRMGGLASAAARKGRG